MRILAADIGGTKSWLCLCETSETNDSASDGAANTEVLVIHEHIYASADYDDFSSLLADFLQAAQAETSTAIDTDDTETKAVVIEEGEEGEEERKEGDEENSSIMGSDKEQAENKTINSGNITMMCLALAGVIQDGHCHLTNIDWELDEEQLAAEFEVEKVLFVNDFQAAAMGVKTLKDDDLIILNPADREEGAVTVITGAGTGLGMAWMQGSGEQLKLFDTEGGHIDFAPTTTQQIYLLQYLRRQHKHVSYERILSGDGLVQLYRFLTNNKNENVTAKKITEWTNQNVFVAEATMRLFIEIYAAYIGNLALLYKPAGGIYIAGGIATHIIPWMKGKEFKRNYSDKGRMHDIAVQTPVYLVTNTRLGLQGAIYLAIRNA